MNSQPPEFIQRNSAFVWVALATAALLCVPSIAMLLSDQVDWGVADFILMGALLCGTGSGFILLARRVQPRRRAVVAVMLAALFLYLWAELAVGIFTPLGS